MEGVICGESGVPKRQRFRSALPSGYLAAQNSSIAVVTGRGSRRTSPSTAGKTFTPFEMVLEAIRKTARTQKDRYGQNQEPSGRRVALRHTDRCLNSSTPFFASPIGAAGHKVALPGRGSFAPFRGSAIETPYPRSFDASVRKTPAGRDAGPHPNQACGAGRLRCGSSTGHFRSTATMQRPTPHPADESRSSFSVRGIQRRGRLRQ
jgi:hypothetical protein